MDGDRFVHLTLPSGVTYSVRQADSGIVLDERGHAVDAELANDLLTFKCWKFAMRSCDGRC